MAQRKLPAPTGGKPQKPPAAEKVQRDQTKLSSVVNDRNSDLGKKGQQANIRQNTRNQGYQQDR